MILHFGPPLDFKGMIDITNFIWYCQGKPKSKKPLFPRPINSALTTPAYIPGFYQRFLPVLLANRSICGILRYMTAEGSDREYHPR
jgi:hypothetical protein